MKDAIGQVLATTRHPILVLLADTLNILQRLLVAFTTTFNHLHHIDDQYNVEQPKLQCALSHSLTHSEIRIPAYTWHRQLSQLPNYQCHQIAARRSRRPWSGASNPTTNTRVQGKSPARACGIASILVLWVRRLASHPPSTMRYWLRFVDRAWLWRPAPMHWHARLDTM
jgi:hypothetical protein